MPDYITYGDKKLEEYINKIKVKNKIKVMNTKYIKPVVGKLYTDGFDEFKCIHVHDLSSIFVCTKDNQDDGADVGRPFQCRYDKVIPADLWTQGMSLKCWEDFASPNAYDPSDSLAKIEHYFSESQPTLKEVQ